MYVIKNAFKCISRSKGRNVLIGIIALVIAISACIGLSIRQAAQKAKRETLENLSITATISFDMSANMQNMEPPTSGEKGGAPDFDKDQFKEMMGGIEGLTLEEYKKYAEADSVKDFYYTSTVGVNGNDKLKPVSTEGETEESQSEGFQALQSKSGSFGGGMGRGSQSEFSLVGISGENALTQFADGTATFSDGEIFDVNSAEMNCAVSNELALYNNLEVGDKITVTNPNNDDETYKLKITGIITDTSAGESNFSFGRSSANDPMHKIYVSYSALSKILAKSESKNETVTDEESGREYETAFNETVDAKYVFKNSEDYDKFAEEVKELGLDDSYSVTSSDVTLFEKSIEPLETLSTVAGGFLLVVLIIGAIILVVLNIFNVRERKYEIGVLTAMGMKKGKVALQFLTEIFVVTMIAVVIGAGIGAVSSVPVSNALLANQIEAAQNQTDNFEANLGRTPGGMGGENGGMPTSGNMNFRDKMDNFMGDTVDYVSEISATLDLTVMVQMLGIAVLLTIVAGAFSMLFIMRYEPLRILSNRD